MTECSILEIGLEKVNIGEIQGEAEQQVRKLETPFWQTAQLNAVY